MNRFTSFVLAGFLSVFLCGMLIITVGVVLLVRQEKSVSAQQSSAAKKYTERELVEALFYDKDIYVAVRDGAMCGLGMSKKEVRELLGEPDVMRLASMSSHDRWLYRNLVYD